MKKLDPKRLFLLAAMMLSVACVNEEYDLNKEIDTEATILKNISVPIGNMEPIVLGEILDISNDQDLVRTDQENGDYYLYLAGEPIQGDILSDPFVISAEQINTQSLTVTFPVLYFPAGTQLVYSDLIGKELSADLDIEIDSDIPSIISEVKTIGLETVITMSFKTNEGKIHVKKGFQFRFPDNLHFKKHSASDDSYTISDGHIITISEDVVFSSTSPYNIALDLEQIDVPAGAIKDGRLFIDEHISVTGDFYVDTDDFASSPSYLSIDLVPSVADDVTVTSVTAKVNIDENVEPAIVTLPEIPDFLSGDDIVLDFYNPMIYMNVRNHTPLSLSVGASLVSRNQGEIQTVNPFGTGDSRLGISSMASNLYLISGRPSEVDGGENIVVPGLSKIIRVIPEEIAVENINVRTADNDYITLNPGEDQSLEISYEIMTPLAFDTDMSLDFTYDIEDLGLVSDADVRSSVLNLVIENSIPLEFELRAECLGEDGHVSDNVSLEVKGKLASGTHLSPTTNSVEIVITNNSDTFELAGLRLELKASVTEHAGTVLNNRQGIRISSISLSLPDGVTIDNTFNS